MTECNTQTFWDISAIWNNISTKEISTMDAMEKLNLIIDNTNPIKPLADKAKSLLNDIIFKQN